VEDYRVRQRDYLLSISRAMTSRLDLPSLLHLILQSAAEMLRGEAGLIALRQEDGDFQVRASYGLDPELLPFFAPLLSDIPYLGGPSWLARWSIPDLEWRLGLVSAAAGLPLRQVIALPLAFEDELIGVIYIFRTSGISFSANDRQILASFADQAAIAVRNAQLYQEVERERRLLSTIIENSADGIMILDPLCRIKVFNRALAQLTRWPPEQALNRPCREVLALKDAHGADICRTRCPFREGKSGQEGKTLYIEGDIIRPGRKAITVGITYAPLYDNDHLHSIIANVRDITRFREAEEMKSTFISAISHELKTPVALIKGYAETLLREDARWDEQTIRESLTVIQEESDRLNRLIDNLLEASRIQAGGLKLHLGDVNIPKLAEKVVEGFRHRTSIHQFHVAFPPDFPPIVADEERIREVLENLVGNAVKYSPKGGNIWVGGWVEPKQVAVYVADQGLGIPEEEQERIFEKFYRVERERGRTEGAGLGLYIVKAIVEAHGGKIEVESAPGKGSKFVFKLPR